MKKGAKVGVRKNGFLRDRFQKDNNNNNNNKNTEEKENNIGICLLMLLHSKK